MTLPALGTTFTIPHYGSITFHFLGTTLFKPGVEWAGIELHDSAEGKNDGSVNGYHTSPTLHQ